MATEWNAGDRATFTKTIDLPAVEGVIVVHPEPDDGTEPAEPTVEGAWPARKASYRGTVEIMTGDVRPGPKDRKLIQVLTLTDITDNILDADDPGRIFMIEDQPFWPDVEDLGPARRS